MEINPSDYGLPSTFKMPGSQKAVSDVEGVNRFDYGKDGYVAWRFALDARPWKDSKVKKFRLEGSDTIPIILFYRDRDNQVPIKLRRKMRFEERVNRFGEPFDKAIPMELGDEGIPENATLLDLYELPPGFDNDVFLAAFEQFKQTATTPGTSIASWKADPGQVATLASLGIYSVEMLGQMSEEAFTQKIQTLPPSTRGGYLELHELAVAYCNRQEGMFDIEAYEGKIGALEASNDILLEKVEAKDEKIAELLAKIKGMEVDAEEVVSEEPEKKVVVENGQIKEIG